MGIGGEGGGKVEMLRVSKSPSESFDCVEREICCALPKEEREKNGEGRKPDGMVVGVETGRRKKEKNNHE